jgi:hypothetical protein
MILQVRVFPLGFQALQIPCTIIKQTGNVTVALCNVAMGTQQRTMFVLLSYMSLSTTKILTVAKQFKFMSLVKIQYM